LIMLCSRVALRKDKVGEVQAFYSRHRPQRHVL
jgi:hypothetical protein